MAIRLPISQALPAVCRNTKLSIELKQAGLKK